MAEHVKARRGDGVVVGTRDRGYTIPQPGRTESYDRERYEVGIVTGITRDGLVRTWRPGWTELDSKQEVPRQRLGVWVLPAAAFDVDGCVKAYRDHHWPGHRTGLPMPYSSLAEVREAMRPHRREEET